VSRSKSHADSASSAPSALPALSASSEASVALAEQLFATVGALRRQTRRLAGRPWPLLTLSGNQVELVRLVRREPDISVAEAAAELGLAPNTVSTLVRQLTDVGLLKRNADVADRRVVRLRLTAAASRRVGQWRDRRTALTARGLDELDAGERAALVAALPAILRLTATLADVTEKDTDDRSG
jgi:DNA-binding MarR family transcriptional regulator